MLYNFRFLLLALLFSTLSCDVLFEAIDPDGFKEVQASNTDHSIQRPQTSNVSLDPSLQQILKNAVWEGDLEKVKRAVNLGANINYGKGTNLPNSPLFTALSRQYTMISLAKNGLDSKSDADYVEVIEYLRSHSTNLSDCGYGSCVLSLMCIESLSECKKAVNRWGMTASYTDPNYLLGRGNKYEEYKFLFQHGLDASKGKNVLREIEDIDAKTLELFLKNGANKRIDTKISKYSHVITIASEEPDKLKLLLDYGADPRINCDEAMRACIRGNRLEAAKHLLDAGVDPNKTCNERMQSQGMFTYAIHNGSMEMAELLKSYRSK